MATVSSSALTQEVKTKHTGNLEKTGRRWQVPKGEDTRRFAEKFFCPCVRLSPVCDTALGLFTTS